MRPALLCALGACALWGLAFVAPAAGGGGGIPLTLVRYGIFGLSSVVVLKVLGFNPFRRLARRDWVRVIGLGITGNTLYYLTMSGAVSLTGPAPVALVFGAQPIIISVVGNLRRHVVRWRTLAGPMACIAAGLVVTTVATLSSGETGPGGASALLGLLLAVVALASWSTYSTWNAEYMGDHPDTSTVLWASLTGIGTLVTLPVLVVVQLVSAGSPAAALASYTPGVLIWGVVLGLGASWVATSLWSRAGAYFSSAMLGMIIVTEVIFAVLYTLVIEARPPTLEEVSSATLTIAGVLWAFAIAWSTRRRRTQNEG